MKAQPGAYRAATGLAYWALSRPLRLSSAANPAANNVLTQDANRCTIRSVSAKYILTTNSVRPIGVGETDCSPQPGLINIMTVTPFDTHEGEDFL